MNVWKHAFRSMHKVLVSKAHLLIPRVKLDVEKITSGKKKLFSYLLNACGAGGVVGIATGYGVDGPVIKSRWGCTCPDRPWGPPSLLYNGYQVFPGDKERPGRDADPLTHF
jgi:hypothetical protein